MKADALPGAMPNILPEGAAMPRDFHPVAEASRLLWRIGTAALGTLDRNTGYPMTTLVTVGLDDDLSPVLLVSKLSSHTANLMKDGRASLLLSESGKGDPLAHPRLSILGEFKEVADQEERQALRQRFLLRHPKAELYIDFGDFSFWRMKVVSGHLNGGFARAADLEASEILLDWTGAEDLRQSALSAIEHMNEDHRDALGLMAVHAGGIAGRWRMVAVMPDGMILMDGAASLYVAFPAHVSSASELRNILVLMSKSARAPHK